MKQKTRDNLIYLGVGLTIAGGLAAHILYSIRTSGEVPDIPVSILWGIFGTPVIVAVILERFWEHRRRVWLWVIVTVTALINVSAVFISYSLRWNPRAIMWSTMTGLWLMVAFILAGQFAGRSHRK